MAGRLDHGSGDRWVYRHWRLAAAAPGGYWLRSLAASCLAVLALVFAGSSWLSASADEPTPEPSAAESSSPPSSPSSPEESPTPPEPSSTPSCQTSQGVYEYPTDSASWPDVPSWVDSPDGFVCVQVVSTLPSTEPVAPPSTTPGETQLVEQLAGIRKLLLYSGGLLIFFMAGLFWKIRA